MIDDFSVLSSIVDVEVVVVDEVVTTVVEAAVVFGGDFEEEPIS